MSDQADFFIAGGTLHAQAPSYVTRPADQELFKSALAGEFCYVLTARQMGKSSLMVRTARRLKDAGVATATVDLTSIGTVPLDTWYVGLLTRIKNDLRLAIDVAAWWSERQALGASQRFIEFLHDVVLAEMTTRIVIFIDEIDSTLKLDFRDDFFAAIRAMYNARANEPAYNRLTFVLLGVATPTDLIQDRERTPFNIGRRIVLKELSYTDAEPLRKGLEASHAGQADRLLTRIFYWTNGHPYLTQKLCLAATHSPAHAWNDTKVDELVETNFFSKEARKDTNLTFVQDRVRASPPADRRRMLKLYRRIYSEKSVPENDRSPIQNHLELFGLVGVQKGTLRVRNQIYRRVFDQSWIKANTPANTPLTIAIIASIVALLLAAFSVYRILNLPSLAAVAASVYGILNPPSSAAVAAEVCIQNFEHNTSPAVRLDALACLFERPGYNERALRFFYEGLKPDEQKYLFLSANPQVGQQVVTVIKGIYVALDDQMPNDREIMDTMIEALEQAKQPDTNELIVEITDWEKGRELAEKGQYQDALDIYNQTLPLNNNNPAAHYDRAIAALALRRYGAALTDLDEVMRIAKTAQTASQSTSQTNQAAAAPSRFINVSRIIETVRETIRGNEQLQAALLENLATYPALAAATDDIVQAAKATQVARAEATQAALTAQAIGTARSAATDAAESALQQTETILALAATVPPTKTPTPTATNPSTPMPSPRRNPTASPIVPTRSSLPAIDEAAEKQLLILLNQRRGENGCSNALKYSPQLTAAARRHSFDMATNHFFGLRGSDNTRVATWARDAGYTGGHVRVNIAADGPPEAMVEVWMQHDVERNQMLDCTYNDVGIGYATGDDNPYGNYWTALFGVGSR